MMCQLDWPAADFDAALVALCERGDCRRSRPNECSGSRAIRRLSRAHPSQCYGASRQGHSTVLIGPLRGTADYQERWGFHRDRLG